MTIQKPQEALMQDGGTTSLERSQLTGRVIEMNYIISLNKKPTSLLFLPHSSFINPVPSLQLDPLFSFVTH